MKKSSKDCGICDVCISNKTSSDDFRNTIRAEILKRLKVNTLNMTSFIEQYSKLKEAVILDEIKKLLEENTVLKEGNKLKLND